jgi:hypothetical protein
VGACEASGGGGKQVAVAAVMSEGAVMTKGTNEGRTAGECEGKGKLIWVGTYIRWNIDGLYPSALCPIYSSVAPRHR